MGTQFGQPPWSYDQMRGQLREFAGVYRNRPIKDNVGGMSSTHCFLMWFALRALNPAVVVESGVWRGQGTWFIEQACPQARVVCIDLSWRNLVYRSDRATYLDRDFQAHDWAHVPREGTVLFFDDHVDAYQRCETVHRLGFRHALFEDNYPHGKGDCYSLKEVMEGTGHSTDKRGPRAWLSRLRGTLHDRPIAPNTEHATRLRAMAEVYSELPPIFRLPRTRWGDPWDSIPTPPPLLESVLEPYEQQYFDEAQWYTWMCYVRFSQGK